jgi:DNA-binding response OmpR family regulator
MDVLAQLLVRPGDVVTKVQLLDNVWGEDFEGDPNIVEVYVGRLRRKVDDAFGRRSIETVRGVGYRVRADGPA